MQIDHIVIKVDDLEQATADYRALGFTVAPGGEHSGGASRNALIGFADGTYLELIAFRRPAAEPPRPAAYAAALAAGQSRLAARVASWSVVPEGLVDLAVAPSTAEEWFPALVARAGAPEGPLPMGRQRPDGLSLRWEMALPDTLELPFVIRDLTPRDLRLPDAREHPNGATGLRAALLVVPDPTTAAQRWADLLGTPAEGTRLRCGSAVLHVIGPRDPQAAEALAVRGPAPFELRLQGPPGQTPRALPPALTHGARIWIG